MRKIIGARLEEERKRLGKKKGEMAAIGGVVGSAYTNYLEGKRPPDADFLAAIAAAGADVQYILTGVRSSAVLAPDEQLLLDRYRISPKELKDAALRVLLLGDPPQPAAKFVAHGDVGQQIDNINGGVFKVDMRKGHKKKE
jgi:transcriptional regulator with XRE-family HTH domain